MSELVTVYHGTRTTAEPAPNTRFRARDAVAEGKRLANLYGVADIDVVLSDEFIELDRNLDEAQNYLSVTNHFETAARYATDGSNTVELLLDAVLDLKEKDASDERRRQFRERHLEQYEGKAVVLEFQLPASRLITLPPSNRRVTAADVATPLAEFLLPEKVAASKLIRRHCLEWVSYDV